MTRFVGLDVSQKMTAICVVDNAGCRLWRGQCPSNPEQIGVVVRRHAGDDARIGIETGAMTPWLVHEFRNLGLEDVSMPGRQAPPSRCKSTRRIRSTRRDWLRSFVSGGTGLFMSSRSTATARVLFWVQGLNSSA
jgi:transposase